MLARLAAGYAADRDRLEALLGRPIKAWSRMGGGAVRAADARTGAAYPSRSVSLRVEVT